MVMGYLRKCRILKYHNSIEASQNGRVSATTKNPKMHADTQALIPIDDGIWVIVRADVN